MFWVFFLHRKHFSYKQSNKSYEQKARHINWNRFCASIPTPHNSATAAPQNQLQFAECSRSKSRLKICMVGCDALRYVGLLLKC
jgi:hypothetical protein